VRLLLAFVRADRSGCFLTLLCLLGAAVAEGIGISSLLPFLGLATHASRGEGAAPEPAKGFERAVSDAFSTLGIEPTLETLLGAVAVAIALKGVLMLLAKRQVGYTVARVATALRLRLVRALFATDWPYFTRQPVGALANAFGTEAPRASQAFLNGATMISEAIALCVYGGIALATSWQMTLVAVPVAFGGLSLLTGLVRLTRRAGRRQTQLLKEVLDRLTDVFQGVRPLKAMAREALIAPLLEQSTQRLNWAMRRMVLTKESVATIQEMLLMVCVTGGVYVSVTLFRLELEQVFLLALLFIRAITSMSRAQRRYQDVLSDESAYWSMIELIERAEREREPLGERAPLLESGIELRNVVFGYETRRVLDDVSFTIPAGRITALYGPSGSGKTTVVDLVAGLVRPQSGAILVDGVPLSEIDLHAWRRMIGYVPQEMFLLHESVALNVSLGDPEVTRADVERALRAAAAWDFVSELPAGMDEPVGERGSRLSGGQRQRVAIARALVRRPKLLILDEATASLDAESDAALWAQIRQLRGETTVLAISHEPGILDVADRIYRVEDGRVAELPARRESSTSRYASTAGSTEKIDARVRSRSGSGGASSTFRMASANSRSSRTGTRGP